MYPTMPLYHGFQTFLSLPLDARPQCDGFVKRLKNPVSQSIVYFAYIAGAVSRAPCWIHACLRLTTAMMAVQEMMK
jgi:hypothetical protein